MVHLYMVWFVVGGFAIWLLLSHFHRLHRVLRRLSCYNIRTIDHNITKGIVLFLYIIFLLVTIPNYQQYDYSIFSFGNGSFETHRRPAKLTYDAGIVRYPVYNHINEWFATVLVIFSVTSCFYFYYYMYPETQIYAARKKFAEEKHFLEFKDQAVMTTRLKNLMTELLPEDIWILLFSFLSFKTDTEWVDLSYSSHLFHRSINSLKSFRPYVEVPSEQFPTLQKAIEVLNISNINVQIRLASGTFDVRRVLLIEQDDQQIELVGQGIGQTFLTGQIKLNNHSSRFRLSNATIKPRDSVVVTELVSTIGVCIRKGHLVLDRVEVTGFYEGIASTSCEASASLIDCVIHGNINNGVLATVNSNIHIFGIESDIRHNGSHGVLNKIYYGVVAINGVPNTENAHTSTSKIHIHLPKIHQTSHDNNSAPYKGFIYHNYNPTLKIAYLEIIERMPTNHANLTNYYDTDKMGPTIHHTNQFISMIKDAGFEYTLQKKTDMLLLKMEVSLDKVNFMNSELKKHEAVLSHLVSEGLVEEKTYITQPEGEHKRGVTELQIEGGEIDDQPEGERKIETPPAPTVRQGDKVKAKCTGWTKFYAGEITHVNSDGTYDIMFIDGEIKRGIEHSQIEGGSDDDRDSDRDSSSKKRREGDRVKVKVAGWTKYRRGKITRINSDGTYDIKFDKDRTVWRYLNLTKDGTMKLKAARTHACNARVS